MKVVSINRKTENSNEFKVNAGNVDKMRGLAATVAAYGPQYFLTVIAETAEELDFLSTNFHNLPMPAAPATRALWTGDLAIFILANYPKEIL